jgi:hypothetical protein
MNVGAESLGRMIWLFTKARCRQHCPLCVLAGLLMADWELGTSNESCLDIGRIAGKALHALIPGHECEGRGPDGYSGRSGGLRLRRRRLRARKSIMSAMTKQLIKAGVRNHQSHAVKPQVTTFAQTNNAAAKITRGQMISLGRMASFYQKLNVAAPFLMRSCITLAPVMITPSFSV